MRKEFEMTEEELAEFLDACKPVPAIMLQCGIPSSPQENANRAWERLGEKRGFEYMTVQPSNKGQRFFSAEAKATAASPLHPRRLDYRGREQIEI